MKTVYGLIDTAYNSCVLLYDVFGNSYAGEPTINLFTQPATNAGFSIKPSNSARVLYKLDYTNDVSGQGNFAANASGFYLQTDSIYKYNFTGTQTSTTDGKHGFAINVSRGETYSVSVDVYVSTGHPRTGLIPVVSLTPNLTGSFTTITGSYNANNKGTWQNLRQKIYAPSFTSNVVSSPTYYEMSVETKTSSHPYYGSGSSAGFKVGDTQGPTLNLYKGASYIFTQTHSSNLNDQIYLSTIPNVGGGSNSYTNGFYYYGNKGLDGYSVFTVPYNAPLALYYNSLTAGSSYFGGKINILGGYDVGNVGNVGNGGNAGNLGGGSTATSEPYNVCFEPTRGESSSSNLSSGYILYKNMQFEKNKPMFKDITHPTKFTSSSRSAYNSFLDLTGKGNNSNLVNTMFDSNSFISFGSKMSSSDGGLIDLNLKYNTTKTFSIGSAIVQSYDFWFKQTAASFKTAYLFSRSSETSNGVFLENLGQPQLIFIQGKRIYFSFTSPNNKILYGYSSGVIELNTLYNITITVNATFATGLKVDIYLNGQPTTVTVLTVLQFPLKFLATSASSFSGNTGNIGNVGSFSNNTNFYCISSYGPDGESKASPVISSTNSQFKTSTKLSWEIVDQAIGYYIYRSNSLSFGDYTLIADINNQNTLNFIDENFQTKLGKPKNFSNFIYDADIVSLTDNSNAKVCFGNYPLTTLIPNYFEGYIYRIAIYNKKLTATEIYRNYNSFIHKYKSENPTAIASFVKQKSVIYKKVKE